MTSKLTRERLEELSVEDDLYNYPPTQDEVNTLARMALAAMDSEPYGFTDGDRRGMIYEPQYADRLNNPLPVYRHAQPDPERDRVRIAHAEWSQTTFGNVGPIGPLKHLSKEALEAAAEPGDLSEWADMQFLLWDAQRRSGITDEQITQAMIEKLTVNKQREWPEPKDGEPRLHIKEHPAPVIPDGYVMVPREPTEEMNKAGWAAMNEHDAINPTYRAMIAAAPHETPALNSLQSVVTVPGKWIPVSERMPEQFVVVLSCTTDGGIYVAALNHRMTWDDGDFFDDIQDVTHWMPLPAAPQEVKK